jgi:hypothetical protein
MIQMTRHAEVRMQQRGIARQALESLLSYGAQSHDHRGATVVYFDKRARFRLLREGGRRAYQQVEKQLNAYAVVADDGRVVTVGHRDRRIPRRWSCDVEARREDAVPAVCAYQAASALLKVTEYFSMIRARADRTAILDEWIERAIQSPIRESVQTDGRIRRWTQVHEMEDRFLRVVLLAHGQTVHNAFFDRRFKPW